MKVQMGFYCSESRYIWFSAASASRLVYFLCRSKTAFQCVIKHVIRGRNAEHRNIGTAAQEDSCSAVTRIRVMHINGAERLNIPTIVTGKGGRNIVPLRFTTRSKNRISKGGKMPPLTLNNESLSGASQYQIASPARKEPA